MISILNLSNKNELQKKFYPFHNFQTIIGLQRLLLELYAQNVQLLAFPGGSSKKDSLVTSQFSFSSKPLKLIIGLK